MPENGQGGELVSPNLSELPREEAGGPEATVVPGSRTGDTSGAMRFTVFHSAETLGGPANRGLPEQPRFQMRGGYRGLASFQNRKFETYARMPSRGDGAE